MRSQALLAVSLALGGCSPVTLDVPRVPNPVTLGPVDRIGGHRAGGEKAVATLDTEANDFVAASTTEKEVGNTVVRETRTTVASVGSPAVAKDILVRTEGRADRDVRADAVPVGSYVFIASGTGMRSRWVGIRGRVVEARHDR